MTTTVALVPAASYVRMSNNKQDKSPERQRAGLAEFAAAHGGKLVREFEYADLGVSGWKERERQEFLRMIADAEAGKFKMIFVDEQSRFSRFKHRDSQYYLSRLSRAGVQVWARLEDRCINADSLEDQILTVVHTETAAKESRDKGYRVLTGKLAGIRAGRVMSGPAYGFDRLVFDADGKQVARVPYGQKFTCPRGWSINFAPSLDTAAIDLVRSIFKAYGNDRKTYTSITRDLNKRCVPTPKGGIAWSTAYVIMVLSNPVYAGHRGYSAKAAGEFYRLDDEGKVSDKAPRRNGYRGGHLFVVRNTHEGIISDELFEKCQRRLIEERGQRQPQSIHKYPLSALLRCGHCGGAMNGHYSASVRGSGRFYRCVGGLIAKRQCRPYSVKAEVVEQFIEKWVRQVVLSPDNLRRIEAAIKEQCKQAATKPGRAAMAKQLDRARAKVEQATKNMLGLSDPQAVRMAQQHIASLVRDRDELTRQFEAIGNPRTRAGSVGAALAELHRAADTLTIRDRQGWRQAYDALFSEITLTWERMSKKRRGQGLSRNKHRLASIEFVYRKGSAMAAVTPKQVFDAEALGLMETWQRVANEVKRLYKGEPLSSRELSRALKMPEGTLGGALARAKDHGRVKNVCGWVPVD